MVAKNTVQLDKELRELKVEHDKLELVVKQLLTIIAENSNCSMYNAKLLLKKL